MSVTTLAQAYQIIKFHWFCWSINLFRKQNHKTNGPPRKNLTAFHPGSQSVTALTTTSKCPGISNQLLTTRWLLPSHHITTKTQLSTAAVVKAERRSHLRPHPFCTVINSYLWDLFQLMGRVLTLTSRSGLVKIVSPLSAECVRVLLDYVSAGFLLSVMLAPSFFPYSLQIIYSLIQPAVPSLQFKSLFCLCPASPSPPPLSPFTSCEAAHPWEWLNAAEGPLC